MSSWNQVCLVGLGMHAKTKLLPTLLDIYDEEYDEKYTLFVISLSDIDIDADGLEKLKGLDDCDARIIHISENSFHFLIESNEDVEKKLKEKLGKEMIIGNKTGILCNNYGELIDATRNIKFLSNKECRKDACNRFSLEKYTNDTEKIYQNILNKY